MGKYKYRLYQSERERLHYALHSISLADGNIVLDSRVPTFYERAKELADQTWAPQSNWEATEVVLDDYDVFVFHQACLRPANTLTDASEWAREVFDPPEPADIDFYGKGWESARQSALKRSDYICEGCGKRQDQHRQEWDVGLHVHHQRPVREFENPTEAHTVENLEVLCVDCHNNRHTAK